MLKKINLNFFSAMLLSALLFVACSDDSSSSGGDSNGVARYTAIIYGQNGGDMEFSIEGTMRDLKLVLGDKEDVRVLLVYKYGLDNAKFDGTLAYPGQLLFFEVTKDADLTKLKNKSDIVKGEVKLYDPEFLTSVIDYAHDSLPAQEYLFFLEAHGAGFDFSDDYPKSLRTALAKQTVKAVMQDEWNMWSLRYEAMTMPELAEGIRNSKVPHFKAILFNNCLMGNMETVEDIYPYTDYVLASEHSLLSSRGELMTDMVESLVADKDGDFEEIAKGTLADKEVGISWKSGYIQQNFNGDFQLLKAELVPDLNPIFKKLASRLVKLYSDEKMRKAIDKAADKTYRIEKEFDLYDARDYANKLAKETGDETLKKIAKELSEKIDELTLSRNLEAHYVEDAPLDHYSLSITLVDKETYNEKIIGIDATNRDSYELTTFHKETGWGDWLNTNTHVPTGNPIGQELEE